MRLGHVVFVLLIIHTVAATIEWEIEYDPNEKPKTLRCRGPKTNGSWHKRWNRTDTMLGIFDANARATTKDSSFTITASVIGTSNIQTTLNLPPNTFGTFGCRFGSKQYLFHLPKNITAYSHSKPNSVTLQCKDTTYPYNISWYLNSTFVALVNVYNQSSYIIDDKNTSFTQLKNISFQANQATTNNTRPLCLTCIVSSNDTFGEHTTCTPNTKDLTSSRQVRSDNFLRTSRLTADGPINGDTTVRHFMGQATGLGFVIGSIAFVCAVAGLVLLIHVTGKRQRPILGYDQQIYRPFSTSSGGTIERSVA